MHQELESFVDRLYRLGSVKVDTRLGFRLRIHRHDPTVPLSPIYVEFGTTTKKTGPLGPEDIAIMGRLLWSLQLQRLKLDFGTVAGVPHGGTAPAQEIVRAAYHMSGREIECLVLDKVERGEHSHVGGIIKGNRFAGSNIVLVEDVASTGRSIEEAVEQLRTEGLQVTDAVAFLDRMQGARENLRKIGVRLHRVMTIHALLSIGVRQGHLSADDRIQVERYIEQDRNRRVQLALAAAT